MATQTQQAITALDTLVKQNGALIETQAAPALEAEVTEGKGKIAKAIRLKGIEADSTDTLSALAQKVEDITQETVQFDLRSYYNNYVWGQGCYNLLEVAAEIKTRYINTGQFKGAIVQDIYYISPTIDLTQVFTLAGVFAVVTSDGDMYANDGVHTPFGVHTWHDEDSGYLNRWVAFLFATDEYTFVKQSTNSATNRSHLVVVGHCKEIGVDYNYFIQFFIPEELGQLDNFRYLGTNNASGFYDRVLVFDNMIGHTTGDMFYNSGQFMYIAFLKMRSFSGGTMFNGGTYGVLTTLSFPALQTFSGGTMFTGGIFSALTTLSFPALQTFSGGNMFGGTFSALTTLSFPALQTMSGGTMFNSGTYGVLTTLSFPALQTMSGGTMFNSDGTYSVLSTVSFPALQTFSGGSMFSNSSFPAMTSISFPALETLSGGTTGTPSIDNMYYPSLKYFSTTLVLNYYPMVNARNGVYIPNAVRGGLLLGGSGSAGNSSAKYLLIGARGEPTDTIFINSYYTNPLQVLEIGDKEYIDAGMEPRWKPRMSIKLSNDTNRKPFDNLTTESMALKLLDRLADNTDGATITIQIGTTNLNRLLADETYAPYVAAAQAKNYTIV